MQPTSTDSTIAIPCRSLIALCGPAGAGKSTFAAEIARSNSLAPTAIVSSDACRLMQCDEIGSLTGDQWAILQPNTFQLFLTIVGMRLSIGRPTLADSVNLHTELRAGLLDHARAYGYRSVIVAFAMSLETCLAHNAQRSRHMPEWQIRQQHEGLRALLPRLASEGWDQIVTLDESRRTVALHLDS